jgi:RND family efflux transporter MFP subunit
MRCLRNREEQEMPVDLQELAIDRSDSIDPKMHSRSHLWTRFVLPLILVLGFLSLVAWASRDLVFPPQAVTVVPVYSTTANVQPEGTPVFNAAGWIEPRPTPVRVAALAPGVVEKLLVVEDQALKVGDLVAELVKDDAKLTLEKAVADLTLRDAELDEANALLKAAVSRLEQPVHLVAALRAADASLAMIQTALTNLPFEVRRAEADLDAAQKDYDAKLAAKGVVAGVEIDIAKSKRDSAKALVEELRDRDGSLKQQQTALTGRRDALKTQLKLLADETQAKEQADAKVKAATARVEQARVIVAEARLQLDRMTIRSPIDGRVFRLIAHPGARIGGGMTQMLGYDGSTVVTMYQPDMLQVRVDVRFEDLRKVRPEKNQRVEIDNPASSSPLTGVVLFVSSEADIQKNTLQVKVAIPNPPSVFKPEMLVDVTFLSPESKDESHETVERIFVPVALVRSDGGQSYVWVADQSAGVARKTAIETGVSFGAGRIEVVHGLNVSTRLITSRTDSLTDGMRITITGESAAKVPHPTPSGS